MSDINSFQTNMNDEVSLKELFEKAKSWFLYFKSYKSLIILFTVIGGFVGALYAKFIYTTTYSSQITFTLEQKGSSTGALGGLASSLGLGDLGGAGNSGMFGGENILMLMKSNRIIHQALKESNGAFNGGNLLNAYLKNHYPSAIEKQQLKLFPADLEGVKFTRSQDSVLLLVTNNIKKEQLMADRADKKNSIIKIVVKDKNELWAYHFSQMLVKHAIDLYMDIKVGKLISTELELSNKQDSIRRLLDGSISTLAYESDLNSHTPLMRYKTNQAKKTIDVEVLKTIYANLSQNLELTKYQRSQEEPIIEIIDEPILPLEKESFGMKKGVLLGMVLGMFLIITVVVIKRLFLMVSNNFE